MVKFSVVMVCASCSWRVSEALKNHGFTDFSIDRETNTLTFNQKIDSNKVINVVNSIGYKIDLIESDELAQKFENLTEEDLLILEDALRNGYDLSDLDFLTDK